MEQSQFLDEVVRRVSCRLAQAETNAVPPGKIGEIAGKAVSVLKVSHAFEHGCKTIRIGKTGIITAEAADYIALNHIAVLRD
ncbi:MAG: hypothetical protein RRY65_05770 [Pseudoflavonifractor sp.]